MAKSPQPRSDLAIEFLKTVYPSGPWALVAVSVDRKGICGQTFNPDQIKGLENWLGKWNGKRNIYWHINPLRRPVSIKANREDIESVDYLHVDIDPRVGEDLEEERKRAIKLLTNPKRKNKIPRPTCILYSGGGIQAFWKLKEPIQIKGDLGRAEDAKRYNTQLERSFGGDNCANIDRIARLPGTLNLPDAIKKKKGRTIQLAELLEFNELEYPLSDFTPAQDVQEENTGFFGETVKISGDVERIESVEDLSEWNVPDRVKVIIVQGRHPDEVKEGDDSRSAWLFDCICQLVRAGVPDEKIFGIITDPEWKISESVLDKGANINRYAVRQIERAKEEAIHPKLREMNERHAVIGNLGGKCRVVEEVMDYSLNRPRITRQSFEDLRNRYMHVQVQIGKKDDGTPINRPLGKWWLEHAKRRQFDTMVFAPGREVPHAYNLWKGFACEAKPGDCDLFLAHVKDNICCGNQEYYTYLINWMARAVQKPDSPGQTAVVLKGRQGTGKGFFINGFGSLFGRHFLQVADPKHLVGSFNAHLQDCVILFGDEAFYAGDKKHESVLKMLITEETIAIERKGVDVETAPNCTHVMLASNSHWVIPAGASERRFFVLEVSNEKEQDSVYFKAIADQMNSGGREALLHFLTSVDLSNFEVRNVPKTQALQDQKILSLAPEEEWWYRCLHRGSQLERLDKWRQHIKKSELLDDYVRYMAKVQVVSRRSNETALGRFLARMCPELRSVQRNAVVDLLIDGEPRKKKQRAYFYDFPALEICRKRWDDIFGVEVWPNPNAELEFIEEEKMPEEPF